MTTPSMEDYLEKIFTLIRQKGYARVSDIAEQLGLQPSSVTKMVQKLAEAGYINYERYRGLVLTEEGQHLGQELEERHQMLADFLRLLGVPEETLQRDVEGIEHHVSPATLRSLQDLVDFFRANPAARESFERHRKRQTAEAPAPQNDTV